MIGDDEGRAAFQGPSLTCTPALLRQSLLLSLQHPNFIGGDLEASMGHCVINEQFRRRVGFRAKNIHDLKKLEEDTSSGSFQFRGEPKLFDV
jgi:hypothetical protein